ncbi:MAG TPA: class I SAM-dependent methyltransferase [Burkholderiales bacterium]|jgi:SAM-dependent methyltransferase|nr:class I SAM-dependent methyltransferase [Caulobacteraceae bacterium]
MNLDARAYVGGELALFERARNWKAYLARQLGSSITGEVAEVGAGIGATTRALCSQSVTRWTCLEPDPDMAEGLRQSIALGELPPNCEVISGGLGGIPGHRRFGAILYVDVLEHIADDRAELAAAGELLARGGRLIVIAPAHQWLFGPFDRAIGHYRRYSLADLAALTPPNLSLIKARYLDSVGMIASAANTLVLRSAMPNLGQILTWDRVMVPVSRLLDPLIGYRLGKTALAIWRHT